MLLSGLDKIDWTRYRRGFKPPDIPTLIRNLAVEDFYLREGSCDELNNAIQDAYRIGSELPIVIIPFLVELLVQPELPDKLLITDLLIGMAELNPAKTRVEPYYTRANNIRQAVCAGVKAYLNLHTSDVRSQVQEDLDEIRRLCNEF